MCMCVFCANIHTHSLWILLRLSLLPVLRSKERLPAFEDILQLRNNEAIMTIFCDTFIPCVFGKIDWLQSKEDNAKKRANGEEGPHKKKRKKPVAGKYTSNFVAARRFEGWSLEGIKRYNELLDIVTADRAKNAASFDTFYLNKKQLESLKNNKTKEPKTQKTQRFMRNG